MMKKFDKVFISDSLKQNEFKNRLYNVFILNSSHSAFRQKNIYDVDEYDLGLIYKKQFKYSFNGRQDCCFPKEREDTISSFIPNWMQEEFDNNFVNYYKNRIDKKYTISSNITLSNQKRNSKNYRMDCFESFVDHYKNFYRSYSYPNVFTDKIKCILPDDLIEFYVNFCIENKLLPSYINIKARLKNKKSINNLNGKFIYIPLYIGNTQSNKRKLDITLFYIYHCALRYMQEYPQFVEFICNNQNKFKDPLVLFFLGHILSWPVVNTHSLFPIYKDFLYNVKIIVGLKLLLDRNKKDLDFINSIHDKKRDRFRWWNLWSKEYDLFHYNKHFKNNDIKNITLSDLKTFKIGDLIK